MTEWNFSPDVIAKAQEIAIGARVAVHWSEAECQDQEGTVVGVDIHRYGKVDYTVHIDGDISPTDGFTHDRSGTKGGTIRPLSPALSLEEEVKEATADRDALLAALGWKLGPLKGRDIILQDAKGLRPEMVRARTAERDLKSDRDWDRLAAAELLRKWVRRKFGPWITWRTAWAAVDEIFPGREALSEGEQT